MLCQIGCNIPGNGWNGPRKPDFVAREQQRRISAAYAQSDHRPGYSVLIKYNFVLNTCTCLLLRFNVGGVVSNLVI